MAKIAIIGAGQVGASCAFALAQTGLARQIALADVREDKARARRWTLPTARPCCQRAR